MLLFSGIGLAVIALICYGMGDFLAAIAAKKVSPRQALLMQKTASTLLLLIGFLTIIPHQTSTLTGLLWALCDCVVAYIGWIYFYKALREAPASIAVPVVNVAFLWTTMLSIVFLQESLNFAVAGGAVLVFAGVILVSSSERITASALSKQPRGILYAFVTLFGWGTAFFLLKLSGNSSGPYLATLYNEAGILLLAGTSNVLQRERLLRAWSKNTRIIVMSGVLFGIALLALNRAFLIEKITIVSPIVAAAPALTAAFAFVFLRERLARHQYAGVLCIVLGLVAIAAQ